VVSPTVLRRCGWWHRPSICSAWMMRVKTHPSWDDINGILASFPS
jgi:hypothetical protein